MEMLDDYLNLQKQIHDYFGYVEDWRVIPIEDTRGYYWFLKGDDEVVFAECPEDFNQEAGNYYVDEIYKQRFLPKYVYRGEKYTMIAVDTQTDGNKFLRIFENDKEFTGKIETCENDTNNDGDCHLCANKGGCVPYRILQTFGDPVVKL